MNANILDAFVQAIDKSGLNLCAVAVSQGDEVIEHRWTEDTPHALYSLSKSYTSMAIGMLADEGLLRLESRIVDLLPDKIPADVSQNLALLTVRDLLIMASGHNRSWLLSKEREELTESDYARFYLSRPFVYRPGTVFNYDTGCTYILSAIVQRVTGQKLVDFLMPRMFAPFGIPRPRWDECPMGICMGGTGLSLRTRDLLPLGHMLLAKGAWRGKQMVSQSYVEQATQAHILTINQQMNPDWVNGYGYQFWMNHDGTYRADGAFGQFLIVMEPFQALIAIHADETHDTQAILTNVWRHIVPALS